MRLCIIAMILFTATVAWAEPAGETRYLPVAIAPSQSSPGMVTVEPGDHLWKISQAQLDLTLGRPAGIEEVGPYWLSVIEANRDRLRSGDPDLIFPGEVVMLPESGG
jgi:nucleoid-associated protein YgaU